ncbi:hypothetical protein C1H46_017939 [Malus baccata]|uniref:Uncharacterized protein n=1 Tax=Malus baccata TaxID=106549 RepID=A0A540MCL9_MALBA|nr:hypothetical protein C1H46_017939 [Malus baccata]
MNPYPQRDCTIRTSPHPADPNLLHLQQRSPLVLTKPRPENHKLGSNLSPPWITYSPTCTTISAATSTPPRSTCPSGTKPDPPTTICLLPTRTSEIARAPAIALISAKFDELDHSRTTSPPCT